jgi:hypothetical protein
MELTTLEWAAVAKDTVAAATAFDPSPLELLADSADLTSEQVRQLLRDQIARALINRPASPAANSHR